MKLDLVQQLHGVQEFLGFALAVLLYRVTRRVREKD